MVGCWVLAGVALAACGLWQSEHSLCRLLTPPNSFNLDSVCVPPGFALTASCE